MRDFDIKINWLKFHLYWRDGAPRIVRLAVLDTCVRTASVVPPKMSYADEDEWLGALFAVEATYSKRWGLQITTYNSCILWWPLWKKLFGRMDYIEDEDL